MGVSTGGIRTKPEGSDEVLVWFVSPHGFGHAARTSAVIAACSARRPDLRHHVFTSVPRWFFEDSLPGVHVVYHRLECDVGMVQKNPLEEDIEKTIRALERLPLRAGAAFDRVVAGVAATGCHLIICDISPIGLAVADRLDRPGILMENFTWDWIYRSYGDPKLDEFGARMAKVFSTAAVRIQTEPVCRVVGGSRVVAPVSRHPRSSRAGIRTRLKIPADHRMLLVSLSGLESTIVENALRALPATTLVVPAGNSRLESEPGIVRVPTFGGPYHPDLVAASDLVLGKLGYSTVAEVYQTGTAFAFLRRRQFPESPILERFVGAHVPSETLPEDFLGHPEASSRLEELLTRPKPTGVRPNGAAQAADLILSLCRPQP
jgi:hypothetical protein